MEPLGGAGPEVARTGRLLVASPGLIDPNFARTVVLIVHHDEGGTLGLVLNRPSDLRLTEPLPQWVPLAAEPAVVFRGGPVGPSAAICLAVIEGAADPEGRGGPAGGSGPGPAGSAVGPEEPGAEKAGAEEAGGEERGGAGSEPPGWQRLVGRLGTLDLTGDPDPAGRAGYRLRVFAGYAGWASGQLAGELSQGGWIVVDARPEDAVAERPDDLWKAVLRRQGGHLALLSGYPLDLSAN